MTIEQAEAILLQTDIRIALQQRFCFDTGTLLRLDNYAIINVFDDGRYYIQGDDCEALIALFSRVEKPWDPGSWSGEMPTHRPEHMPGHVLPWIAPRNLPPKRFD